MSDIISLQQVLILINEKQPFELREIKGNDFTKATTVLRGCLNECNYLLLKELEERPVRGLTAIDNIFWIYISDK